MGKSPPQSAYIGRPDILGSRPLGLPPSFNKQFGLPRWLSWPNTTIKMDWATREVELLVRQAGQASPPPNDGASELLKLLQNPFASQVGRSPPCPGVEREDVAHGNHSCK